MSPSIAVVALLLGAVALLLLPLIPGLVELYRKSDAAPLNVVQQHAGEIRHFANGFRAYLKTIQSALRESRTTGLSSRGVLPDGVEYIVLGGTQQSLDALFQDKNGTISVVVASGVDLALPGGAVFTKDIYSAGRFSGAAKNIYRAILGEKDVRLGESSLVQRWVHAVGKLQAQPGCQFLGRVSSDDRITLHRDCRFVRVNAPRIEIGVCVEEGPLSLSHDLTPTPAQHRLLHDGDFEIQAGGVIRGNLVIRGRLRIGTGARVCGSVKSDKNMTLEDGVTVEGSLISARKMHVGRNCVIHGPIIAERQMRMQSGTRCGTAQKPTTLSAPQIEVEEGVVAHGTLWAREHGLVVATQ